MTGTQIQEEERSTGTQGQRIYLPLGMLGFERTKRYVLLSEPDEAPFLWLQMVDAPGLAFLVIPPCYVLSDYRPELSAEDAEFLELTGPDDSLVYNIVTLHSQGRATVNLKGPIVVNRRTWRGKQAVLVNAGDYSLHYPLPAPE